MKNLLAIIVFIYINSCGYKVININDKIKVNIIEINSEGEKRINYIVKNKINYALNETRSLEESKPLIINFKTTKNKTIKEKNIKNEITKYNVNIQIKAEVYNIKNQKKIFFTLSDTTSYNVESQNSITRNNEKNVIKTVSKRLAKEFIDQISSKINDL